MGLFFYTKIGSIIFIGDLPTTNIIEPLYAVENRLTSMVRVESILLIQLTVISLLRLINRIGSTPEILNIIITLIALASGTAAILVAIMRIYENRRK